MTDSKRATAAHALEVASALIELGSDAARGLSAGEAALRRARYGENALPEPAPPSIAALVARQFMSPLIALLLVAAAIAAALSEVSDALVIVAVVVLNAAIGALQEGRAERSLRALRKLAPHNARVIRDGREQIVPARELVPGDVIDVNAGDAVPADARLLEQAALQMSEAALTGESVAVAKTTSALDAGAPLPERTNMIFSGTHVAAGRAKALVVAIGTATEIGQIAALARAAKQPRTPLERRVAGFGRAALVASAGLFLLVIGLGRARGVALPAIFMVAVSQIVGLVPEGLPAAMTIALAVGVQRMARRRAVVRRLSAVETLGATRVICSDKTGTLTKNEMTATALVLADGRAIEVSGAGYAAEGALVHAGHTLLARDDAALAELLELAVLCNDAALLEHREASRAPAPIGDPTEVALLTLAQKAGIAIAALRARLPRSAELPFDPGAKLMATEHRFAEGPRVAVKGAPEVVLELCDGYRRGGEPGRALLDAGARARLQASVNALASRSLRVLALAVAEDESIDAARGFAVLRGRCTLLGFVGEIDPPRAETEAAIARCRAAGIRPIMVTGDHKATGLAIALQIGLARPGDQALDGRELEALDDAELDRRLPSIAVFARVHPAQKLRIVEACQRAGEVVAMTGDGVNDAPALVRADVGVAMGSGTDVAKDAAKIVLTDDNFASLVAAVEEGRVAYRNIKKAVLLLISTSFAEVVILLLAMALGYPPPFAAVQILWNNLVTEGVVTVNLIMEPPEGDEMMRPPLRADEPLIDRALLARMAVMVPCISAVTLGWWIVRSSRGVPHAQVQTEAFTLLAVCEWFNALNCRSDRQSAFRLNLFRNPWLAFGLLSGNVLQLAVVYLPALQRVFHTRALELADVLAIGAVASLVLWTEELRKLFARRRVAKPASR